MYHVTVLNIFQRDGVNITYLYLGSHNQCSLFQIKTFQEFLMMSRYKLVLKIASNNLYFTEILIITTMSIQHQNYKDSTRIRYQNRFDVESLSSPYSFDIESTTKSLLF